MASTWTIAGPLDECGYDGAAIREGDPVELVGARRLKRCVDHRHSEVNWAEVDQARHAAEIALERAAIGDADRPRPVTLDRRIAPSRPVRSLASMAEIAPSLFDHKAAAVGDRD